MNQKTITPTELKEKLYTLLACDALELIYDTSDPSRIYIPFMMNDALEYYFILENCQATGLFLQQISCNSTLSIIDTPNSDNCNINTRFGLIIRHPNHETTTIWFSKCIQNCRFYQYHRIGHFWTGGMEHWRRLVYIIGTLHEKYTFLGDSSCNTIERELLSLIEFAPFRYWSPLHESLDDYYINSPEGILCMKHLAKKANDFAYVRMIQLYEYLPHCLQTLPCINTFFAKKLTSPKHWKIYEYLFEKINTASEVYDIRDYGPKVNEEIKKIRTQFTKELYTDGYVGQYPYFTKGKSTLIAMEEHPFTILESSTFKFKICGMIFSPEHSIQLYRN